MKRILKRIITAALSAATVFSFSSSVLAANLAKLYFHNAGTIDSMYIHNEPFCPDDPEELKKITVDLTDPAQMYKVLLASPANPENCKAPETAAEKAQYEKDLAAFRANLVETMLEMGVELKTNTFEELAEIFNPDTPAPVAAWLRYFRDEARTDEIISLADVAVGDTVYYTVESVEGYYCTYIDINCPIIRKGQIYADIPGSEIKVRLSVAKTGNVDGDGSVTLKDVIDCMRRMIAPTAEFWRGYRPVDLNLDGSCDAKDVIALMRHVGGQEKLPCNNIGYKYKGYLKARVISIKTEGSDDIYETPLPAPLPDSDSRFSEYYYGGSVFVPTECYSDMGNPNSYVACVSNDCAGVFTQETRFWMGYSFAEIDMVLVEGDKLPVVRVEDPNTTYPYSGIPHELVFRYSVPEDAKTVKATVRIAYLVSPDENDYQNIVPVQG